MTYPWRQLNVVIASSIIDSLAYIKKGRTLERTPEVPEGFAEAIEAGKATPSRVMLSTQEASGIVEMLRTLAEPMASTKITHVSLHHT